MVERKTEMLVGITVSIACLILVLGLIWGKGMKLFSTREIYSVRFDNVKGLGKGDPVVVRGVDQGQVSQISLHSDCALVYFWIERDIPLFKDASVTIENQELMGGKQLSVDPGIGPQKVEPGTVFYGETRGDFDDFMKKTDLIFTSLDTVLTNLKTLLNPIPFKKVIQNLELSTAQLHAIIDNNQQRIDASMQRIDHFTRQVEKDSTVIHFNSVIGKLDSSVTIINDVLVNIKTQKGTLGKMAYDPKLYDHLVKVSSDLDSLIADIQRSPKRYFHISVF